ncbi:hypothetical protein CFC21_073068 [Triticum aestivum]|uniref:Uncharacterized protein n=2 Tax=Triticum aestivum TaxID=4565 RepID=A0A3B6LQG8_WHEAT|nr:hypothetical protein CFC21_073068 [Triticum aestivum]
MENSEGKTLYSGATNCKLLVQHYMWHRTTWILARHHYRAQECPLYFPEAFLLSKHMTYSITTALKGSMIRPWHVNPNSSLDILSSSPKIVLPRYAKGTSNRLPSVVYMMQWPLSATGDDVQHASSSLDVALTLWHFLTN